MNDGTISVTPLIVNKECRKGLYNNLMMFFTGNTRDSRKILSEQSNNIENKRQVIDELVITVDKVYDEINKNNIDIVGTELDRTWQIKKSLSSGISNENIDKMYSLAKNAGAIGGKVLGAGGGGFMLLYVKDNDKEKVRKVLSEYREVPFSVDSEGSRIIFAD